MNIFEKFYKDQVFDGINNISRWNNARRIKDETVAHHSFLVTLFVDFLVERLFADFATKIPTSHASLTVQSFKLKAIRASLMHDFTEITSGDVLYTVKNNEFNGKALTKALDEFVDYKLNIVLQDVNEVERDLFLLSTNYYDDDCVKGIVKVGDWLACIFYIYKERQLGNTCFDDRFVPCQEQLEKWIGISKICLLESKDFIFTESDFKVFNELEELIKNI